MKFPYIIYESALDDIDNDEDVYDDNFTGDLQYMSDDINPNSRGEYNFKLTFVIVAIPNAYKQNIDILTNYIKMFDDFVKETFMSKLNMFIKEFNHPVVTLSGYGSTSDIAEYKGLHFNHPLYKLEHYSIDKLKRFQIMYPCNINKSLYSVNALVTFAFKKCMKFMESYMNDKNKNPVVMHLKIEKERTDEVARISENQYNDKHNTGNIIKLIKNFQQIICGKTNDDIAQSINGFKTYRDHIKSYVNTFFSRTDGNRMDIKDTPDAYIVVLKMKSVELQGSYNYRNYYDRLLEACGKPVIFDLYEYGVVVTISYSHFYDSEHLIEKTTKKFKKLIIDCGYDDGTNGEKLIDVGSYTVDELIIKCKINAKPIINVFNTQHIKKIDYKYRQ